MKRVKTYKYLDLILSNTLFWSAHTSSVCGKDKQILNNYWPTLSKVLQLHRLEQQCTYAGETPFRECLPDMGSTSSELRTRKIRQKNCGLILAAL